MAPKSISVDDLYFYKINSSNKAYILGLLAADGCVASKRNAVTLMLQKADEQILVKISNELNYQGKIRRTPAKNPKYSSLEFSSSLIKINLAKYNIVPRKTHSFSWPNLLPEKYNMDFIRGYFDGDGCWSIKNRKKENAKPAINFSIGSVNEDFLLKVEKIIRDKCSFEKERILYEDKRRKSFWTLKYDGNKQCEKIFDVLYRNNNALKLQRKYNKAKKHFAINNKLKGIKQCTI